VSRVSIGRAVLGGRVQATAAIGVNQPGDRSERYGDFDLAATHPVGWGVHAGVDARYRVDLAQDADDSPTERQWDAQLAAFASHAIGRFALMASAGYAGWKMRFGTPNAGALATLSLAAQFW
jgi:hypothetical protein